MSQIIIIEQLNKNSVIIYERTSAERISKSLNRHGVIVYSQCLINVEFSLLNFLLSSLFFTKNSQSELAIIYVDQSIFVTLIVLFHLLASDEAGWQPSDLLIERLFVGLQIVHSYPELSIIFLGNGDGPGGII